jgi:hypothetical protein
VRCQVEHFASRGRFISISGDNPDVVGTSECVAPVCEFTDGGATAEMHRLKLSSQGCMHQSFDTGSMAEAMFFGKYDTFETAPRRTSRCNAFVYSPDQCTPMWVDNTDMFECIDDFLGERKRPLWWHTSGDSTLRMGTESVLHRFWESEYPLDGCEKFNSLDWFAGPHHSLRLTFEAGGIVAGRSGANGADGKRDFERQDLQYFKHTNWLLDNPEVEGRPDIMLLGPSWAYTAWKTNEDGFTHWIEVAAEYMHRALSTGQDSFPMKILWKPPSFTYSPAHDGSERLTYARMVQFNDIAERVLKEKAPGVILMHTIKPLTSIPWSYAYDGLHSKEPIPSTIGSMVLNHFFEKRCGVNTVSARSAEFSRGLAAARAWRMEEYAHVTKMQKVNKEALVMAAGLRAYLLKDNAAGNFWREDTVNVWIPKTGAYLAYLPKDACMENLPRGRYQQPVPGFSGLYECYSCRSSWSYNLGTNTPCFAQKMTCDLAALQAEAEAAGVEKTDCNRAFSSTADGAPVGVCHFTGEHKDEPYVGLLWWPDEQGMACRHSSGTCDGKGECIRTNE